MRRTAAKRLVIVLAVALGAAALSSLQAGRQEIQGAWRRGDVPLDGSLAPWDGTLEELGRAELTVGMVNDDQFLYLCLKSADPRLVREAMMRGLVLEFEPKGGESFLIQYPIGVSPGGEESREQRGPQEREKMWEAARSSLDTFLLADAGSKKPLRFAADNGFGIRLHLSQPGQGFVYQVKIPLQTGPAHPHALGITPGSRLTLFVRMPERERSSYEGRPGGGMRGGMRPGGGAWGSGEGMRGGAGRGPMAGGRGGMPPPLNLKIRLRLAEKAAAPK